MVPRSEFPTALNGQDITDQYFDTDARLKSLKIQEERELVLLQQAIKLADILELEKELNSVRYQIESYIGTLRKWDSLVDVFYKPIRGFKVLSIKPMWGKHVRLDGDLSENDV